MLLTLVRAYMRAFVCVSGEGSSDGGLCVCARWFAVLRRSWPLKRQALLRRCARHASGGMAHSALLGLGTDLLLAEWRQPPNDRRVG